MAANDTAFVLATTKPVSLFWKCWPIVTLQWNPTLPEIDLPCEKP